MKLTTARIRQGWKLPLTQLGFQLQQTLFVRKQGVVLQTIGVQRNLLSPTWKVNLSVCIRDEFMKDPELRPCLSGNVSPNGARCYDDRESWWPEENIPAQLAAILKYVGKLTELKTDGVPVTAQVTGLSNVARPDEVASGTAAARERLLDAAPERSGDFIQTTGVFA